MSARFSRRVRFVQFVSDLVYADATSSDCVQFHKLFQRSGFESVIYAGRCDSHHEKIAQDFQSYRRRQGDLVLFHYSAWSPVAEFLRSLEVPLVLIYHNITPPDFFGRANPQATEVARKGLEILPEFTHFTSLALGMSDYSRQQLELAGFEHTGIMPILVDFERLRGEPNKELLEAYRDDYVNLLFVGRVDPNKKQEDLIKVFYYYQRRCNPRSRLFLVGAHSPEGPYHGWMATMIDRLGLTGSVHFTGQTAHRDLLAFFRLADAFVCMSEHEGFCVPVVESMYLGVPVVAYASTAIPFTIGDAGVLIRKKDFAAIAEIVNLVTSDQALRHRLIAKGRERAHEFDSERVESILAEHLAPILNNA